MRGNPTACWWREPILSLFLRAQVTEELSPAVLGGSFTAHARRSKGT